MEKGWGQGYQVKFTDEDSKGHYCILLNACVSSFLMKDGMAQWLYEDSRDSLLVFKNPPQTQTKGCSNNFLTWWEGSLVLKRL